MRHFHFGSFQPHLAILAFPVVCHIHSCAECGGGIYCSSAIDLLSEFTEAAAEVIL